MAASWARRVKIVETGEVFANVQACADAIGGDYSDIYKCLRGERETHCGYTFAYYGKNSKWAEEPEETLSYWEEKAAQEAWDNDPRSHWEKMSDKLKNRGMFGV